MSRTAGTRAPLALGLALSLLAALLSPLLATRSPAAAQTSLERVYGANRIGTAVEVSRQFFDSADGVVLATANNYADALAAGPLARQLNMPILLSAKDTLTKTVEDEIERLGAHQVYVIGGSQAISPAVVERLENLGFGVERLSGENRFGTASVVAQKVVAEGGDVAVTLGWGPQGFADALSGATLGMYGHTLATLLTQTGSLPIETATALENITPTSTVVVGGEAAVNAQVFQQIQTHSDTIVRIKGQNRYATAVQVALATEQNGAPPTTLLIARGDSFPDSLVAGALTQQLEAPLLLVPPHLVAGVGTDTQRFVAQLPELANYLQSHCESVERVVVLGGQSAISTSVTNAISELLLCEEAEISTTTSTTTGETSTTTSTTIPDDDDGEGPNALVAPPLPNTGGAISTYSATRFLWDDPNPTQTGVDPGTIEPERAAALTGHVYKNCEDFNNCELSPLGGVTVSVVDHPELGTTLTRADGQWDMALNGGGSLTVRFERPGYLPAERNVALGWGQWNVADDVVLLQLDPEVSEVNLPVGGDGVTHKASTVVDSDGTRYGALWFPPGVTANFVGYEGENLGVANTLGVRVTEYTAGPYGEASMPGYLPPPTAFTYAAEFSADEVIDDPDKAGVTFSEPVSFYLLDFVGFAPGTAVPFGTYDFAVSSWVPEPDGVVFKITGETNGMAIVDAGPRGDATALGLSNEERRALLELFEVGDTLQRMTVTHFTPGDPNFPVKPPEDAVEPDDAQVSDDEEIDEPDEDVGYGLVGIENQSLTESFPIVGASSELVYSSGRVPGRNDPLRIRLTGPTFPVSLERVELTIDVAGRRFEKSFEPEPNLFYEFQWDGLDAFNRRLTGTHDVSVRIDFVYPAIYAGQELPEGWAQAWGLRPLGNSNQLVDARRPIKMQSSFTAKVGNWQSPNHGLGGWTLSQHHGYDPKAATLHLGNGAQRSARNVGADIDVFAAIPDTVTDVAVGPNGVIYAASEGGYYNRSVVYRVVPGGEPEAWVGNVNPSALRCTGGDCGIGGPGTEMSLGVVSSMSVSDDGSLLISDSGANRVVWVSPDGQHTRVLAGNGQLCSPGESCGDAGAAQTAPLGTPVAAVAAPGARFRLADNQVVGATVYIAEQYSGRVRQVSPDGSITTVAGATGNSCIDDDPCGDNGPADAATFGQLSGLDVDAEGRIYTADAYTRRVRVIDRSGLIRTVAGTGKPAVTFSNCGVDTTSCDFTVSSPSGDGDLATDADLIGLGRIALSPNGQLYLVESPNLGEEIRGIDGDNTGYRWAWIEVGRVRAVAPNGTISTVAGVSPDAVEPYELGDGVAAAATNIPKPVGLGAYPNGNVLVASQRAGGGGANQGMSGSGQIVPFNLEIPGNLPDGSVVLAVKPPMAGFDGEDLLIPAADGSELYVFDAEGRHLRTHQGLTGAVLRSFSYDSAGRLVAIETQTGGSNTNITQIGYDTNGYTITSPYGDATRVNLDQNGYVASVTNPGGETATLEHDALGLLTRVTGARQNTTYVFGYEAHSGRLVSASEPGASSSQILARTDFDNGWEISSTSAEGHTTTYRVENLPDGSNVRTRTYPDGSEAVATQLPNGSAVSLSPDGKLTFERVQADPRFGLQVPLIAEHIAAQPSGLTMTVRHERSVYGSSGDPFSFSSLVDKRTVNGEETTTYYRPSGAGGISIETFSAENRPTVATLDRLGRTVYTKPGDLAATDIFYDGRGRQCKSVTGSGVEARVVVQTFSDDDTGCTSLQGSAWIRSITDAEGRTISFDRDENGRATTTHQADGTEVVTAYDLHGNPISVTLPSGVVHSQAYNDRDIRSGYTNPLAKVTQWLFNDDGQATRTIRPDNGEINLTYNSAGRLATTTTPGGIWSWGYDSSGRISKIEASSPGDTDVLFSYDGTLITNVEWASPVGQTLERGHDNQFRLTSEKIGGVTTTRAYDGDGALTVVGPIDVLSSDNSAITTGIDGVGVKQRFSVNDFGELTNQNVTFDEGSFTETMERDKLGRVTQRVETIDGESTTYLYSYNTMGRLVEVSETPPGETTPTVRTYTYDNNGNRLSGPAVSSATYNNADQQLSYGSTTFTYADDGSMTSRTNATDVTSYSYDALGRLRQVDLPDGRKVTYGVDGLNRRVAKWVDDGVNEVLVTTWAYRDDRNPIAEKNMVTGTTTVFSYVNNETPALATINGDQYRIVSDFRGSPRLVVNASGTVVASYDYDEFGARTCTGAGCDLFPYLGFAGGIYDPDTALVLMGERDYDPSTGRFTSVDPLLFEGGQTNLYLYADADPINRSDVTGTGPDIPIVITEEEFAEEVARMEGIMKRRMDSDSLYDVFPASAIGFDSKWHSDYLENRGIDPEQLFTFRGHTMKGSELNYYFQGMLWASYDSELSTTNGAVTLWKSRYLTYPSDEVFYWTEQGHNDYYNPSQRQPYVPQMVPPWEPKF